MSAFPLSAMSSSAARIPPYFLNTDHRQRVLAQLRGKHDGLEKYIYLNGLKERDPNLFYEVLLGNMLEIIPILYTPTVRSVFCFQLISALNILKSFRSVMPAPTIPISGVGQKACMSPSKTKGTFDKSSSHGPTATALESQSSLTVSRVPGFR